MKRLGVNQWLLILFGSLLLLLGGDYLRSTLSDTSLVVRKPAKSVEQPEFAEGKRAPDFTLPDGHGHPRKLSKLAGKEALLTFASDDARCRALLRYVGELAERRRAHGWELPVFITVADFDPSREDEFIRQTGLKQIVLYEPKGGPIARKFRSEARPRCFQLAFGTGVTILGRSPTDTSLYSIGEEILIGWQMRSPVVGEAGFRAPKPEALHAFDPKDRSQGSTAAAHAP